MAFKSISTAVTTLVFSCSINAATISIDWQTTGDNLITQDTVSGLEWLDLTETSNKSYNFVNSELSAGGSYDGWRYASTSEVIVLWCNFDIDLASVTGIINNYADPKIDNAAALLGDTFVGSSAVGTTGMTADLFSNGQEVLGAFWSRAEDGLSTNYLYDDRVYLNPTQSASHVGSYLVRTSVVPVPAAVWLFGSGLLGLVGVARRKVNV